MKLSFDWLGDFVDLSGVSVQEVAEKLTMGAFEVEEVKKVGPDIEGPLVVGKILEINAHPNADKIRLTKIRVAENEEPLEIVCGAGNIEVGQIIPVALPGAKVIDRHKGTPLHIKVSAIRGVTSNGMLCSTSELGLPNTDVDGILILSDLDEYRGKLRIGDDARRLLNLEPDYVLHVEPRSNRGDALCVLGLAREVAALIGRPLKLPQLPKIEEHSGYSQDVKDFKVSIESEEDCPFFSLRTVRDIKIGPAPSVIARRLETLGLRTVNNVVDITNYVMLELGQPLHAYDADRLKGTVVLVRRGRSGEKVVTIDGKEREVTDEVLVIAEENDAIGIAGVMGGKDSEIGESTTSLALEAAAFNPARVRRSSRLLGLSSDSSLRFERGVDPAGVARASDRAIALILEHCAASSGAPAGIASLIVDTIVPAQVAPLRKAGNDTVAPVPVTLRLPQLKRFLDVEFTGDQVIELLTPLGFKVEKTGADAVTAQVPSFRKTDVTREIDLVEEVCRIWGYDRVPVQLPPSTVVPDEMDSLVPLVKESMTASGLHEAWISSLVPLEHQGETNGSGGSGLASLQNQSTLVQVLNPLSPDHQALRQSLLPGLIRTAAYNQDHGQKDVWLFEVGRVYEQAAPVSSSNGTTGVKEELHVGGILMGQRASSVWQEHSPNSQPADFYRAKAVVERLLSELGISRDDASYFRPPHIPGYLHPWRSCQVSLKHGDARSGKQGSPIALGWIGELHPTTADDLGLRQQAEVFEINIEMLRTLLKDPSFKPVPSTPSVVRDLTVDLASGIDHAAVRSCILSTAGKTLISLELVSIFQLDNDRRSLSFRLTFQHPEETLTTEQVDKSLGKVRENLGRQLGGTFRT